MRVLPRVLSCFDGPRATLLRAGQRTRRDDHADSAHARSRAGCAVLDGQGAAGCAGRAGLAGSVDRARLPTARARRHGRRPDDQPRLRWRPCDGFTRPCARTTATGSRPGRSARCCSACTSSAP
ncbi:MAG: hypothetical protein MZW92_44920 [Comamonadaceae bacterium]|nr:hypothetical protein [Comamonadaceae bacterium]